VIQRFHSSCAYYQTLQCYLLRPLAFFFLMFRPPPRSTLFPYTTLFRALRGDLPSGGASAGELRYASDLVAFVRERTGDHFHIEVACYPEFHPQARSPREDLASFKRKIEAGADAAITQYFYNIDSYFRFVDDCEALGIDLPIVPGIMPIGNFSQLARFSDACGAEIPRWLRLKMQSLGDDVASIRSLGLDVVTGLCDRLLSAGAPGLHFYTMNQAGLTSTIWQRLGI